jgi:hypothetical protein
MPTIVPTQVVGFIGRVFPEFQSNMAADVMLTPSRITHLSTLLDLVDKVPNHLIVSIDVLVDLSLGVNAIRTALRRADRMTEREHGAHGDHVMRPIRDEGGRDWSPVVLVREAFRKCRDEGPAASPGKLSFIDDAEFGAVLETDIASLEAASANGEWKAATVLGGSIVEALLLWAIERKAKTEKTNVDSAAYKVGVGGICNST